MQVQADRRVDDVQTALVEFATGFTVEDLGSADIERCTLHVVDTFASFMAGYESDASRSALGVVRALAAPAGGASLLGTSLRAQPDLAAFFNATTSREAEQNDVYFPPIGGGNHPSDVLLPLFNLAEHSGASGADFLTAVIVAYQVFLHIADQARINGFDQSAIAGMAVATAAGRLLRLAPEQMANAIAIAAVANNPLNQSRRDTLTMWKAAAAGEAGRAGVFAALLAKGGMQGPSLPFTGQLGWTRVIARGELDMAWLDPRKGGRLRIYDVMIKPRAACAAAISSIIAAEKAYPAIANPETIRKVTVTTYEPARAFIGNLPIHWNPTTRESADHSIPYAVAATLVDGTAGVRQFSPERLFDPVIRRVLSKVEVISSEEFTAAYRKHPPEHHTTVEVELADGRRIVGEAGGAKGDMANAATEETVTAKFRELCEPLLGQSGTERALDVVSGIARLPRLDNVASAFIVPSESA